MRVGFTIPGRVRGQGRIRHKGKQHFMDVKTRSDRAMVAHFASQAMYGLKPIVGPVEATVVIWLHPPASWSKRRREAAEFVTGKPDCDNVQKLLFDACNGIVFADDSQIAVVNFQRRYSLIATEHVDVRFTALTEQQSRAVAA